MLLTSSHSALETRNGLTIEVSGLCYDETDGTPCGFDKITVGPLMFDSLEDMEEGLPLNAFSEVWNVLIVEAKRVRAEDKANIAELKRWLDKRRNG